MRGNASPNPSSPQERAAPRTSLFLLATMQREGGREALPLRVRNLSASGLSGDSQHLVTPGERLAVAIPAIGPVEAEVIWCDGHRFGLAFAREIDPGQARRPLTRPEANTDILPPVRDHRRPGLGPIAR